MNRIVMTGGGSAGHVTPNIALIEKMRKLGWEISYIGSRQGIERELISKLDIPYYGVATGKLRRYFSWQNFIDPFKISLGVIQAYLQVRRIKPKVIFSKGGFVSFPVVVAGYLNKIPVVLHESDFTPGLANKISFPFANKICITFPETEKYLKQKDKVIVTGTPIRNEFFSGNAQNGKKICGFTDDKPVILVMGGGLGANKINDTVRTALPELLPNFNVVHICGKGKKSTEHFYTKGYVQFEYLHQELFDVMAAANIVISRSGANSLYELLALKKLHILIPLSKAASRGDQIVNAKYFEKQGLSEVIAEEQLTEPSLLAAIAKMNQTANPYAKALAEYQYLDGTERVYDVLTKTASEKPGS